MFSSKIWLLFLGLLAVTSFSLAQDYDGDDDGDDFFSGESDDDDFAAASGTPGNSGASGDDQSSGTSYGGSSPMYGSGGIEAGGLGGFGLGASPFSGALPSLYGAYGAASHPKVKVAPAPPTAQKRNSAVTDNNIQAASESLVPRETVKEHRIRRDAPSRPGQIRIRRATGITGPIYTYIKTDYHGNFKWGARHNVGQGFHRR